MSECELNLIQQHQENVFDFFSLNTLKSVTFNNTSGPHQTVPNFKATVSSKYYQTVPNKTINYHGTEYYPASFLKLTCDIYGTAHIFVVRLGLTGKLPGTLTFESSIPVTLDRSFDSSKKKKNCGKLQ
jgi:hypothetical protein